MKSNEPEKCLFLCINGPRNEYVLLDKILSVVNFQPRHAILNFFLRFVLNLICQEKVTNSTLLLRILAYSESL